MSPVAIIVAVLAVAAAVGVVYLLKLRRDLQRGVWMKRGSVRYRRWFCPGKSASIETLRTIVDNLRDVSMHSVGTVLKYPPLNAESDEELRQHMSNKKIGRASCRERVCQYV